MNKENFLTFVDDPGKTSESDQQTLSEILSNYPYFQTAHILLLYNLKKTNSEKYDQQLRESAIQVPNRHILFNLIYGLNAQVSSILQNEEQDNIQDVDEHKAVAKEVRPEIDSHTELLEIDENSQNLGNSESTKMVEFAGTSEKTSDLSNQVQDFELEYETIPDVSVAEQTSQPSPFDLIEKFIEENPAFVPNRLDLTEEREDISLKSIVESEDLASETLASVYEGQKLYYKAISMYEKLILKIPEKSAYFASRIEELRSKVK